MTNEPKKKKKRYPVLLNEVQMQQIIDLQSLRGYETVSEVIRAAIAEFHSQFFKSYMNTRKAELPSKPTRAERLTKEQERTWEGQRKLCESLGGTVDGHGDAMSCTYMAYHATPPSLVEEYEQSLPCSFINESTLKTQYYPDRETVMHIKGLKDKQQQENGSSTLQ